MDKNDIKKYLIAVSAILTASLISWLCAKFAKQIDPATLQEKSSITQIVYAYGSTLNNIFNTDTGHRAVTTADNQPPTPNTQPSVQTPPPPVPQASTQETPYSQNGLVIYAFKAVKNDDDIIVTFKIRNTMQDAAYVALNNGPGFSLMSDAGSSNHYTHKNLQYMNSPRTNVEDYTAISKDSEISVAAYFYAKNVRGTEGTFNLNLYQLKDGKVLPHNFSRPVKLPE